MREHPNLNIFQKYWFLPNLSVNSSLILKMSKGNRSRSTSASKVGRKHKLNELEDDELTDDCQGEGSAEQPLVNKKSSEKSSGKKQNKIDKLNSKRMSKTSNQEKT